MLKFALRIVGGGLLAGAIVMLNLAIFYSSVPHYEQMGWAIFCGVNAVIVAAIGVLTLVVAESHEVAMRQLDRQREREGSVS